MKTRKRITDIIFLSLCSTVMIAMAIGIFILPRTSFSESENRALSPIPSFSLTSFTDGNFFTQLSDFYADNIPFRQQLVQAKAICELSMGKRQNNGVIFSQSGRLTDTCHYDSTSLLEKNLKAISEFCGSTADALCVFVPRSIDLLSPNSEEQQYIRNAVESQLHLSTSLLPLLNIESYYKTDHHLTTEGAYTVYRHICEQLGTAPLSEEYFQLYPQTNTFLGSIYSRSGLLTTTYDTVSIPTRATQGSEVECHDHGCGLDSLYDKAKLDTKDKYSVFLGGNHGVLTVSSTDASRPKLLIVKDSFANAIIPFLAEHFDMTVVDPRYSMSSIGQLIKEQHFDSILILCGIDTLATNGAFERILY